MPFPSQNDPFNGAPSSSFGRPQPPELPPQPRTLWEMFTGWTKKKFRSEDEANDDFLKQDKGEPPNPMDWTVGVPILLNASHGAEFADSLVVPEAVRHCVRKLGHQEFGFVDYRLRVTQRKAGASISYAMLRCFPRTGEGWDKILLRKQDEFGFDQDFQELLDDPTGIFNIDDAPDQQASFLRQNGLKNPWNVLATVEEQQPGTTMQAPPTKKFATAFRYWDFNRSAEDPVNGPYDEFLFIEISDANGWTELWRGGSFVL